MIEYKCDTCGSNKNIYEVNVVSVYNKNDFTTKHLCGDCTYLQSVQQLICGPFYEQGASDAMTRVIKEKRGII